MPEEAGRFETIASHRLTKIIVALGIGLALTFYVFQFATDPRTTVQRGREEAMVHTARGILHRYVAPEASLEIVDPLAPRRAIGKVYVYPSGDGFEVSGYYRRGAGDSWHPFLVRLDGASRLVELSVRDTDPVLKRRAEEDPGFVVRTE